MSVIVYRLPQVINLVAPDNGAFLMNLPLTRNDFFLFRYVDNEIDVFVRNIDRKPVDLSQIGGLTMFINDPKANSIVMTRDLVIVDPSQGLAKFFATGDEVAAFCSRDLSYSVVLTQSNGVEQILYTDQFRNAWGDIEVKRGPVPAPVESLSLDLATFMPLSVVSPLLSSGGPLVQYASALISGPYPGAVMAGNAGGQHSTVLDLSSFTGKYIVQGSLVVQSSMDDSSWFNVTTENFNNASGLQYVGFEGNLIWVRFIIGTISGAANAMTYRN